MPNWFRMAKAKMGVAKQSPIKWIFTVAGIIERANAGFLALFSAHNKVSGIAAELDMRPNPVMAAGSIFLTF